MLQLLLESILEGKWQQLPRVCMIVEHLTKVFMKPLPEAMRVLQSGSLSSSIVRIRNPLTAANCRFHSSLLHSSFEELLQFINTDLKLDREGEALLIIGLYLAVYHPQSMLSTERKTRLMADIVQVPSRWLTDSQLGPSVWQTAFSTRNIRLSPSDPALGYSIAELWLNSVIDDIRVSFLTEIDYFSLEIVQQSLNNKRITPESVSLVLLMSYCTVLEFCPSRVSHVSSDLELLAIYANELPKPWFNSLFTSILVSCLEINSLDTSVLGYIFKLLSFQTIPDAEATRLEKTLHYLQFIVETDISIVDLYLTLLISIPRADSPLNFGVVLRMLRVSRLSSGLLRSIVPFAVNLDSENLPKLCDALVNSPALISKSLVDLADVKTLFGSISLTKLAIFDKTPSGGVISSLLSFGNASSWSSWIEGLISAVVAESGKQEITHVKVFALLGILQTLGVRRSLKKHVPKRLLRELGSRILHHCVALRICGVQLAYVVSIVFSACSKFLDPLEIIMDIGNLCDALIYSVFEHEDGIMLPNAIYAVSVDFIVPYIESYASSTNLSPVALASRGMCHLLSQCINRLYLQGKYECVHRACTKISKFCNEIFLNWSNCALSSVSFDQGLQGPHKEAYTLMFRYFQRVLSSILVIFTDLTNSVAALVKQNKPLSKRVADETAACINDVILCHSRLHFISSQFGIDGVPAWKRQFDTFAAFLLKSPLRALETLEMIVPAAPVLSIETFPPTKSASLFWMLLLIRLIRVVPPDDVLTRFIPALEPYLTYRHDPPIDGTWKPDPDDMDLFDAAHSVVLQIFAHASLFRDVLRSYCVQYTKTLIELFPRFINVNILANCFCTIQRGFGPAFFRDYKSIASKFTCDRDTLNDRPRTESDITVSDNDDRSMQLDNDVKDMIEDVGDWTLLEDESLMYSRECLNVLLDVIHKQYAPEDAVRHASSLSGSNSTESSTRMNEILEKRPEMGATLVQHGLITTLVRLIEVVPFLHTAWIMAEIQDIFLGNPDRNISAWGLTNITSPLWTALYESVTDNTMVDYSRRKYVVEWYMDLYDRAEKMIREKNEAVNKVESNKKSDDGLQAKL